MAQESFTFALNMTTNTPTVVRAIISQLETLRANMGRSQDSLRATGDLGNIEKFVRNIEAAVASGANLQNVLKSVADEFKQLAAASPQFAAGFNVKDFGNTLFQRAGVTKEQFDLIRSSMEADRQAASELANAGVAGFDKITSSIQKSNEALTKAIALQERLRLSSTSVARAGTARRGESARDFIARAGGVSIPQGQTTPVIDTGGALQRAMEQFQQRLNLSPLITKLRQQAADLRKAADDFDKAGDADLARRVRKMSGDISTEARNLEQRQNATKDLTNKYLADLRTQQDNIKGAYQEVARLSKASGRGYVEGISELRDKLRGAVSGDAFKAAFARLETMLNAAERQLVTTAQGKPKGQITQSARAQLGIEVDNVLESIITSLSHGFGTATQRAMAETQRALQSANKVSIDNERLLGTMRLESARATAASKEEERLLAQNRQAALALARAQAMAQDRADAALIAKARPDYTGSQRAAGAVQRSVDAAEKGLVSFSRATSDAARDGALNRIRDNLEAAVRQEAAYANAVQATNQVLGQVSATGQNRPDFKSMTDQMGRSAAVVNDLTSATGRLAQVQAELAVAEGVQARSKQASAALSQLRVDDSVLLRQQGRRLSEVTKFSGQAETALKQFNEELQKTKGKLTDEQLVKVGSTLQNRYARIVAAQQAAQAAQGEAQARFGALSPLAQQGVAGQDAANRLAEANARLVNIELQRITAEKELAAVSQSTAVAANNLASATQKTDVAGFFAQFKKGFVGARQPPEQLGVTARTTLYYGIGYRILGQMEQIAAQAFQTLQDFQIGLAETGDALGLSTEQTKRYGSAVLDAAAQTGTAADDLLRSAQRMSIVFQQPGVTADASVGETTVSMGQLARVTGQAADDLTSFVVAIGQSYQLQGDVTRKLGDIDTFLTKQTSIPKGDTLKATAQIAELGKAAGFSLEQLMAFSAQIESSTGQTADAVSGYLSQILGRAGEPAVQQRFAEAGVDVTKTFAEQWKQLAEIFQRGAISDAVKQDIVNAFGRGRVGGAALVLLQQYGKVQGLSQGAAQQAPGSLERVFGRISGTLGGQLQQLAGQFQQTIVLLGQFSEALVPILKLLNALLAAFNNVVEVFTSVNVAGHSVLGTLLALNGALRIATVLIGVYSKRQAAAAAASAAAGLIGGGKGRAGLGNIAALTLLNPKAGAGEALTGAKGLVSKAITTAISPAGLAIAGTAAAFQFFTAEADKASAAVAGTTASLSSLENGVTVIHPENIGTALDAVNEQIKTGVGGWTAQVGGFLKGQIGTVGREMDRLKSSKALLEWAQDLQKADTQIAQTASGGSVGRVADYLKQSGATGSSESLKTATDALVQSGTSAATVVKAVDEALSSFVPGGPAATGADAFIQSLIAANVVDIDTGDIEKQLKDAQQKIKVTKNPATWGNWFGALVDSIFSDNDAKAITDKLNNPTNVNAAIQAVRDAIGKTINGVVIDISDGLSSDEVAALVAVEMKNLSLGKLDDKSKKIVSDSLAQQLRDAWGDAEKQSTFFGSEIADAARKIVGNIQTAADNMRAEGAKVPTFSVKTGVSGNIKAQLTRVGNIDRMLAEATAAGNADLVESLTKSRQEAGDIIDDQLQKAQQLAEAQFAGIEKSGAAIRAIGNIVADRLKATGGDVNQMADILANTSKETANFAIASLKRQLAAFAQAFAAAQAALQAAILAAQTALRNVQSKLAGEFASKEGRFRTGKDVAEFGQKFLAIPEEQFAALPQDMKDTINNVNNIMTSLANIGTINKDIPDVIGSAERAKEKTGDTAAQIAAAAELASATRGGDIVRLATAKLHQAMADLAAQDKNTVAYYNALANVYEAENALAEAQLNLAAQARKFGSDLTDPVAQAQLDLQAATAAVQDAVSRGKDASVVQGLQLEERSAANAAEEAKFRQFMSDLDTNRELGRITDRKRIDALEAEKARLEAIVGRTRQQQDMLDEVEKALKSAAGEMDKQFNIGDIKLPTVYQVRRYIQTMTAGLDFLGSSLNDILNSKPSGAPPPSIVAQAPSQGPGQGQTVVNNQIKIDGADVGMVKRVIIGTLGASEAGRVTSLMRKY